MDKLEAMIAEAHAKRVSDMAVTPLVHSPGLSEALGCELFLKCEHLQTTGSFKYRGASNKLRLLSESGERAGVITASSGNHGQAVALAGRNLGLEVTVYVSTSASPAKTAAIGHHGARLVALDLDPLAVEEEARRISEAEGKTFISPYNDLDVVAGQGTIGVELLDQHENLDAIFISVGGGGLISGVGTAIKAQRPATDIIGCWPENAPAMYEALNRGAIIDVPESETLSDGTAGGIEAGSVTFPLCQRVVDSKILVSEAAIAEAMRNIADHERWIVEGAAGVALAGLAALAEPYRGKTVAALLCGRNIAFDKWWKAVGSA